MKIAYNERLDKYTTFKMGGIAKTIYFPENNDDLITIYKINNDAFKYIIGGGSNLLINDMAEFETVICLRNLNKKIIPYENGKFYVGAGVRLQNLINEINKQGYGGIEYLFSVPALVGGAVYMNAGRGKRHGLSISDYIESVDILENGEIHTYRKEFCDFDYRHSTFQNKSNSIIVGVCFKFKQGSPEEFSKKVQDRINFCKEKQDMSAPNFGSLFCEADTKLMWLLKITSIQYSNSCVLSRKSMNWMINKNGTFNQAIKLINKIKNLHRLFKKSCRCEIRIWE